MGVQIEQKGSKKTLDAEINLVPFIDFLSVCICFLLVTAVFTQVSQIDVQQAMGASGAASAGPKSELELRLAPQQKLLLVVKSNKKTVYSSALSLEGLQSSALLGQFQSMKSQYKIESATITTSSGMNHGLFVDILDSLRGAGFDQLGVQHGV